MSSRSKKWRSPLGSERVAIRDELERLAKDGPMTDQEEKALFCLIDFWWNSALDRDAKDRAERGMIERLR